MKAITIHNPWAWLIANGHKRYEVRNHNMFASRLTGHDVAIHASKTYDMDCDRIIDETCGFLFDYSQAEATFLTKGHVLAVARCVRVFRPIEAEEELVRGAMFKFETPNSWLHELTDVRLVKPFLFRGCQGIFEIPDARIERALVEVVK